MKFLERVPGTVEQGFISYGDRRVHSQRWLVEFAYRVDIGKAVALAALVVTAVSLATMGLQSLGAALLRPARGAHLFRSRDSAAMTC